MLRTFTDASKNTSIKIRDIDLPKNHEGCCATHHLLQKMQIELKDLKSSVANYEKQVMEYKNLLGNYLASSLLCIEDLDNILSNLGGTEKFEKRVLRVLKKEQLRKSKENEAHTSSHAKNDHVKMEHVEVKKVFPPSSAKSKEYKRKHHEKVFEDNSLGKDNIKKQHTTTNKSRPHSGQVMYSCPTGTAYDSLGILVNSDTQDDIQQEDDDIQIKAQIQHLTNMVFVKKSENSILLNCSTPKLPFY